MGFGAIPTVSNGEKIFEIFWMGLGAAYLNKESLFHLSAEKYISDIFRPFFFITNRKTLKTSYI